MLDHMLFQSVYWMQKTNDVASKLANYNNLQNQLDQAKSQTKKLQSQINSLTGTYVVEISNTRYTIKISDAKVYVLKYDDGNRSWVQLSKGNVI